jgi:hypothetical protein
MSGGMKSVEAMTRDELEGEVVWLREEMGLTVSDGRLARVMVLGVTRTESVLLLRLYGAKGAPVRDGVLEERLAAFTGRDAEASSARVGPVLIQRIRKRLGAGVIMNTRGVGFALSEAGLALIAAALGDDSGAAA